MKFAVADCLCFPGYRSAELAYAVTGHSAQGGTVHTGIALVTGAEDRQWLYPAMTRGTDANLAFGFTTPARPADAQPGTRPAPGLSRYEHRRRTRAGHHPSQRTSGHPDGPDPRQPVAVLADILGRDGAALSATAVRQRNPARRRTGRPGSRRGHRLGRRRPRPSRSPGHRQRPGRPDPHACRSAVPAAPGMLGRTGTPLA